MNLVIATTLLDASAFAKCDLVQLYRARWNAELDLRSLKQTVQMNMLRCKTPELVRKELWTHILEYNLVRTIMAQSYYKDFASCRLSAIAPIKTRIMACGVPVAWSKQ